MTYKTIVSVVVRPEGAGAPLDAAIELARKWDAHLHVLCLGLERIVTDYYFVGASVALHKELLDKANEDASAIESAVNANLQSEDIRWSVEKAVVQPGTLATLVGLRARYADLVILPQPYGPMGGDEAVAVTEAALFGGRAPVLVLPPGPLAGDFSERIVLAWNESDEALRAARAALPLLKAANSVDIAVVDPRPTGPERSDPGGVLSEMLARHGVKTEVSVLAKTLPRVSEVLIRHTRDKRAGMIVMGAYGHSRLREAILGGATRAMLEISEVPVLLAH